MLTIPNFISLLRLPLALMFLQEHVVYRVAALCLAMASDILDGYLARKYKTTSRLGTLLDPLTDKLFVMIALGVLFTENRIQIWEAATMLCRDFAVIIFGFYLAWRGALKTYKFQAIICGKITTFIQFSVLLALTLQIPFSPIVYSTFILLGILALGELYFSHKKLKAESNL